MPLSKPIDNYSCQCHQVVDSCSSSSRQLLTERQCIHCKLVFFHKFLLEYLTFIISIFHSELLISKHINSVTGILAGGKLPGGKLPAGKPPSGKLLGEKLPAGKLPVRKTASAGNCQLENIKNYFYWICTCYFWIFYSKDIKF